MVRFFIYLVSFFTLISCRISEDCFKDSGEIQIKEFNITNFKKIKVTTGIALKVKQAPQYKVSLVAGANMLDRISVEMQNDILVAQSKETCNWDRSYLMGTLIVETPNLEDIISKTEQRIESDGVLTFPILRLQSLDLEDGEAGTGDFYFNVNTNQLVIESNHISNFYLNGSCTELLCNFYFGDGRFYGQNLQAQNAKIVHKGSNDIIVKPIEAITGTIYSTGNVILKNNPPVINVQELFSGRLILN